MTFFSPSKTAAKSAEDEDWALARLLAFGFLAAFFAELFFGNQTTPYAAFPFT